MGIFITGTSPKVGKTFVTAALASVMQALSYKTAVYKAIQLGAFEQNSFIIAPDIAYVKNIDPYITTECTYHLKETFQPVVSAEVENVKINPKVILKDYSMLANKYDVVIVDGTGYLMSPIAPRFTNANLIKMMNTSVVIITNPSQDEVSNTILTVNHAYAMGLKINGVIINKYPENNENYGVKNISRLIEEYTETSVIGAIKEIKSSREMNAGSIISNVLNGVDMEKVFDFKIPKLGY